MGNIGINYDTFAEDIIQMYGEVFSKKEFHPPILLEHGGEVSLQQLRDRISSLRPDLSVLVENNGGLQGIFYRITVDAVKGRHVIPEAS